MPPGTTTDGRRRQYVFRSTVRPSVNIYYAWRDISLLSGQTL